MLCRKYAKGKLITSPDDPRKFVENKLFTKTDPLVIIALKGIKYFKEKVIAPLNDGKTFFASKAIDNMTNEEFLNVQDIIDTQIKNKFAPSEYEAKQGVASGAYIYVDEYTRDDGTKVKGYYRKR